MQVEFNASHIYNTRITSVNVGEFYRIFAFRFSFRALFDTQLMNLFESMVLLIIQVYNTRVNIVFTLKIRERQILIAQSE